MMQLEKYKLGEIAFITKLAGFEHTKYIQGNCVHEKKDDNYIPLFIGKTIKDGKINPEFDWYISKDIADKLERSQLKKKCIVLPYVGTLGDLAIFDGSYYALLGSNVAKIELEDNDLFTEEFIYYYLKSSAGQAVLLKDQQGGVQKNITMDSIRNVEIPFFDKEHQLYITSVLSSLDRKIALNRAINRNLEALAKQLYDYWFVQFDFPDENGRPYKSSGGKMVWNELLKREIPEGWEVKSVNDVSSICRGVSYKPNDLQESGVLILRGNNIENNHIVYDNNTAYLLPDLISDEQKIKKHDIIITMSSGSKEHIGKCAMFQSDSEHSFGAFLSKITPDNNCPYFLFLYLISQYFKQKIKSICNGTGINNLTNQTFDEVLFAFPEQKVLTEFEKVAQPIFDAIGINETEIASLTRQRDELLPLLMNGQVTIE